MTAFIIVVVSLMVFVAAGNKLVCLECTNLDATEGTCAGKPKDCSSHVTTCEHTFVEVVYEGQPINLQVFKGCSTKACTHISFTDTIKGISSRLTRVCCDGDYCNNGTIALPPRINIPNGRRCPSCYQEDATECDQVEIMNCTGDETGCITFKGELILKGDKAVKTVAHGCATLEKCEPHTDFPEVIVPVNQNMTCIKAPEY